MVILLVAFLSGMLSILTPCVLPLLPAILASSASGGRRRPIGIVVGLVCSFTIALLAFSAAVRALGIPPNTLRWIAAAMLIGFGAVLIVPMLKLRFEQVAGSLSRFGPKQRHRGDGLWSGVAVGAGLGFVWAPCVGPILGGVAVASSTATTGVDHIIRALAFALGMSIPLLGIVFGGRRAASALRSKINPRRIQVAAGVVFIATGIIIAARFDTQINSFLSRTTGVSSTLIAGLEQDVLTDKQSESKFSISNSQSNSGETDSDSELPDLGEAPDFAGITQWINTSDETPLNIKGLGGKVVLVDFWTYSCINCLRTLPYIKEWNRKYADDGLVIVGVHAPEFEFEKDEGNVRAAVKENDITYPVAMDNDFVTWMNYDNRYWPAKYLIDRNGRVRYTHFGEGDYDITEQHIRELLKLQRITSPDTSRVEKPNLSETHETYIGYERAENFRGSIQRDITAKYGALAGELKADEWTLTGTWTIQGERAIAGRNAAIHIHYRAADVFLVLGPTTGNGDTVTVHDRAADGKFIALRVDRQRLYTLRNTSTAQDATMQIDVPEGIAAYAFTFG